MTDFPKLPRLKVDDENMEKMHVAARKGQRDEIQRLIDTGVDPAIQNRFGCTALHLACKFGCVDTAKFLASICEVHTAWHGQKPLHLAVMANSLELVEALIHGAQERGQSVETMLNECDEREVTEIGAHVKTCRGQTALHWCVGLGPSYVPMMRLLVNSGASPTARDKSDETVLMRAMEFKWPEAVEIMLSLVPSASALRLDYIDKEHRSHMHWAILSNYEALALRFVELGQDVNMEDSERAVPLFLAIRAAMVPLTKVLLEKTDVFQIQSCPFHNGKVVQMDRIAWLDFVPAEAQEDKNTVVQLLQARLDDIIRSLNEGSTTVKKKKRAGSVKKMQLAPSAPYRNADRSRSRSRSRNSVRK